MNAVSDLTKYYVETKAGHIQHFNADKKDTPGLGIFSTFYFPNASITVSYVVIFFLLYPLVLFARGLAEKILDRRFGT